MFKFVAAWSLKQIDSQQCFTNDGRKDMISENLGLILDFKDE